MSPTIAAFLRKLDQVIADYDSTQAHRDPFAPAYSIGLLLWQIIELGQYQDLVRALLEQNNYQYGDVLSGVGEDLATFAVRDHSPLFILIGLIALDIGGLGASGTVYRDWRDTIPNLPMFYRAAELIGVDGRALYERAADIVGPPGNESIRGFLDWPDKSIERLSVEETVDEDGQFWFRRHI